MLKKRTAAPKIIRRPKRFSTMSPRAREAINRTRAAREQIDAYIAEVKP